MAELSLSIGGRSYPVACRDGEEAHLQRLAAMVDRAAARAQQSMGGLSEVRQLLFASLLLADELHDSRAQGVTAMPDSASQGSSAEEEERLAARIASLAERLDRLGRALETENNGL